MTSTGYDWLKFWVHFAFGTVLGLVISIAVFGFWFEFPSIVTWSLIAGVTLTIATLGGVYGYSFWTRLLESRFFKLLAHWWP